ncbi:hypothetical protein FLL45_13310 [Aliikangiella marina]|uniref:Uncharacterized protein n=1 Tax=Aliikangiella marina TaxID=1712262 RepID=A0A545T9E5_9GAMM|nr:hypothetical protein [Aliikangiella marina]TQV73841.1 hypothetical protein FLL45_13310 [Aliikangiella marina]
MIIKHEIKNIFNVKGKLHVLDVIGIRVANTLKPGKQLECVFQKPSGEQYKMIGTIVPELVSHKGQGIDLDKIGGSLAFYSKPNNESPEGWKLFVHIESDEVT